MDHHNLEKMASTAPMLPNDEEKVNIIIPTNGVGKVLIREDTVLGNINGCACGRATFTCGGVKNSWSSLCWGWGRKSDRKYYTILSGIIIIFLLSFIGAVFFSFSNAVNSILLSSMAIKNNSLAFFMWQKPTVNPKMKVYLFNYTNWEQVRDGYEKKLRVEEVGPYVYSQQLERVNIRFQGDRLTYQEKSDFRFLPEKTNGMIIDQVFVPNLPLLSAVSKSLSYPSYIQTTLNTALLFTADHPNAFLKLSVREFLWGYPDRIIDLAKTIMSFQGPGLNFREFGLLASKNGTNNDRLTINTGEFDVDKMNIIEGFNGEKHLNHWSTPECNSIEASDGSMFPPSMIDRKKTLQVFFPNLCRRLPFHYEKDVEMDDGIQLLRYRMPLNVFDDPAHNPANQCYCLDDGSCSPRGVINVTGCTMGAPALASFPHFYLGDESLREDIEGLNPNPHLHDSFVDIHPTLGLSLHGKSRLQINIQVRKSSMFTATKYLKQGLILPIAWLEMAVDDLPDSIHSLVYHGTYSTVAAQMGLTIFFIISFLVSTVCLIVILMQRRTKPCATVQIPYKTNAKY